MKSVINNYNHVYQFLSCLYDGILRIKYLDSASMVQVTKLHVKGDTQIYVKEPSKRDISIVCPL